MDKPQAIMEAFYAATSMCYPPDVWDSTESSPAFEKSLRASGYVVVPVEPFQILYSRITEYLGAGGLFNPELMEHDKVRDLLRDCRDAMIAAQDKEKPND